MKDFFKQNKILFIILGFVLLIFILIETFFIPTIELVDGNVIINYKDKYKEPGYEAFLLNHDISSDVIVKGDVNTKKIGNYKIVYSLKKGLLKFSKTRVVKVRDLEKPKIILSNEKDIYVCPGNSYKVEKYSAVDNYDGDITSKVKVIHKLDKVIFTVTDSSSNTSSVSKKINYKDTEKPKLELKGNLDVNLYVGDKYVEQGYYAVDNCSSDITSKVKISGSVDTSKVGNYKLIYEVSDDSSNKTVKERNIVVRPINNGIIYLTFDDGPRVGTTNVILDILKEEGVKATFFVTNGGPDYLIKREYDEGHTVALHTYTHDYAYVYSSSQNFFNDLESVHRRVYNITGYDSKIMRFPGGSSNTISRRYKDKIMTYLTQEVLNRKYKYHDWNINSGDAGATRDSNQIVKNVTQSLSHDRVNMVLMHDIKPYTRDALRQIIKYGKDNGYTFAKIEYNTEMVRHSVNN